MRIEEFKEQFSGRPVIDYKDVIPQGSRAQAVRNQLYRWQKAGKICVLRKGLCILSAADRKVEPDPLYVANFIYEPSYVSLEYALGFYGLIPERVKAITSVSTRKTAQFDNILGRFIYQHIRPEAFRGFSRVLGGAGFFLIADPEKALADYIYLNLPLYTKNTRDALEHSLRLQNIEGLDPDRLLALGALFQSKTLKRVLNTLVLWVKEARA